MRTESGETPLWVAAREGADVAVQKLVDEKADVNAKDQEGVSVLAIALKFSREDFVEFLRHHGAVLTPGD